MKLYVEAIKAMLKEIRNALKEKYSGRIEFTVTFNFTPGGIRQKKVEMHKFL
jgi:hypothetical protein